VSLVDRRYFPVVETRAPKDRISQILTGYDIRTLEEAALSAIVGIEGGWTPAVFLNPLSAGTAQFKETETAFNDWRRGKDVPAVPVVTGWNTITPQMAEALLMRDTLNRQKIFSRIQGYSLAIKTGQWKKTGQTVTVGCSGRLLDGAHRLWSIYLTGIPAEIYCIIDIDDISEPHMFAYIDNGAPRSGGDALFTAGNNGLSKRVAKVIAEFAYPIEQNFMTMEGIVSGAPLAHLSPAGVLAYSEQHPTLSDVSHLVQRSYKPMLKLIGNSGATYLAWQIVEEHGYDVLHQFVGLLLSAEQVRALPDKHPVKALHAVIELHQKGQLSGKDTAAGLARRKMILTPVQLLAYAITAFNMTMQRQMIPGKVLELSMQGFPTIIEAADLEPEDEAAD